MENSFEDNIKKLETIVSELEKGELSLDESIEKFENGMKISKECSKKLEEAEKKINVIINGNEESFVAEE